MSSTFNNDNVLELIHAVTSRADSLEEATQCFQAAAALLSAGQQERQLRQDDQRRGYLMNDIYRVSSQLGIASHELRNLKAMTTPQLEAYAEELYWQSRNASVKRLSAA